MHKDTGTETISRPHSRKLLAESSLPLISRFPHCRSGFSLATQTANPSIAMGSIPASRNVSRIGDGGKFGFQGSLGGDVLCGVGQELSVGRAAGDGETLCTKPRVPLRR